MERFGDKFILNITELGALTNASIEVATRVLKQPRFDPNEDALPFIVNRARKLIYGDALYSYEELQGSLSVGKHDGQLIEDEGLYKAVKNAFGICIQEVHAVYIPEDNHMPGWYSAAVDLFRPGMTFKVYFSLDENGKVCVEDLHRWRFG